MNIDVNPGDFSEELTIIAWGTILIGNVVGSIEVAFLQNASYVMAIALTSLTIFLNRHKYWDEFKKTITYKFIKNAFKKTK